MPPNRASCKFFVNGACLKGEHCEYAHDLNAPANNICTFYQRGACTYGSRCRYDHVNASRVHSSGSSLSTAPRNNICTFYQRGACIYGSRCKYDHVKVYRVQSSGPSSSTVLGPFPSASSGVAITEIAPVIGVEAELSPSTTQSLAPTTAAWSQQSGNPDILEDEGGGEARGDRPTDRVICSFAAIGNCTKGENCPHIHGDLCPTCGKHSLHPFLPEQREEHSRACEEMQNNIEALKRSQEIECSVCLECVLSKSEARERKFGLLSECDHPFCITCIMKWRKSLPTFGMDVTTLRTCPICRKLSYYVIPSPTWYFSKEEKEKIIDNYKAKLKSIDCKRFNFGNGSCPFGARCFYKHTVKPGSLLWKRTLNPNMYIGEHMEDVDDDDYDDDDDDEYDDDDDDDHDEPLNITSMDALRALYEHLHQPHVGIREEMHDVIDEDLLSGDLAEMALLLELEELEKRYSGDYDEEDFLTPWERSFLWSQLG